MVHAPVRSAVRRRFRRFVTFPCYDAARRVTGRRRRRFTRPDQRRGEPLKQSINNGRLIQAILLLRRNVGSLRAVRDLLTDGAATGTKILR